MDEGINQHTPKNVEEVENWLNENKLFITLLKDLPIKNIAFKLEENRISSEYVQQKAMVYAYSLGLVAKMKVQKYSE